MTSDDIIYDLARAYAEGYIKSFSPAENDFECSELCDDCPATEVCKYLSEGGDYTKFKANYSLIAEEVYDDFSSY